MSFFYVPLAISVIRNALRSTGGWNEWRYAYLDQKRQREHCDTSEKENKNEELPDSPDSTRETHSVRGAPPYRGQPRAGVER